MEAEAIVAVPVGILIVSVAKDALKQQNYFSLMSN